VGELRGGGVASRMGCMRDRLGVVRPIGRVASVRSSIRVASVGLSGRVAAVGSGTLPRSPSASACSIACASG
jgi:hypothetical protein